VVDAKDGRSLLARGVAAPVLAVREDEHGGRVLALDRDRDDLSRARQEAVPQGDVGVGPQAERTGALHEHRRTREQASSPGIVVCIEAIAPGVDDTLRRRRRVDTRGGRCRRESQSEHGASDEDPHRLTIRQCIAVGPGSFGSRDRSGSSFFWNTFVDWMVAGLPTCGRP